MNYLKKSFNREKPNMPVIIIFLAALIVDYDSPRYRAWPGTGEAGNDGKHIVEQNSGILGTVFLTRGNSWIRILCSA